MQPIIAAARLCRTKYERNWIDAPLEPALLIPYFATVYESDLGGRLDLVAKRKKWNFCLSFGCTCGHGRNSGCFLSLSV